MDRDDVGLVQPCRDLGLAAEPRDELAGAVALRREVLERDDAPLRVSRARWISPMPPRPISSSSSYGLNRSPPTRPPAAAGCHDRRVPPALFAGIYVGDFGRALSWYVRLLGDPTFYASPTEAVWELAPERWVYVQENLEHAGHSVATIFPEDLDTGVAEIAARGLEPSRREDYPGGIEKVVFVDPDGNEVGVAGTPSGRGPG